MIKNTFPVIIELRLVLQVFNAIIRRSRRDKEKDAMIWRQQTTRLVNHARRRPFIARTTENGIQGRLANNQVKRSVIKWQASRHVGADKRHGLRADALVRLE